MNKNIVEFAKSVPDIFIKLVRLDIINKKEATEYALSQEFSFMEKFIKAVKNFDFEVDDLVTYYNSNRRWLYIIYSYDYEIISQCLDKILFNAQQEGCDTMNAKLVYLAKNVNIIKKKVNREKVKLYLEKYIIATNNFKFAYKFATSGIWDRTYNIKNFILKNASSEELLNFLIIEKNDYTPFLGYESVEDIIIKKNEAKYIVELARILIDSEKNVDKYTRYSHLEILRKIILNTNEKYWINEFNELYKYALELYEEDLKFQLRSLITKRNYKAIKKNKEAYQELFLDKPAHEKEAIKRLRTLSLNQSKVHN